jgi:uncharacterized oxidoreductase
MVERGNQVIVCGRRREALVTARSKVPGLQVRVCDVSKPRSRLALLDWILTRFKSLNILVNNAGIQRRVDFRKGARDLPHADGELATNLGAPIHLTALLIPHLRRRREAAIVNISSGLGFTPLAAVPVYSATKAAIHSLCLSIRHQLRDTPIRVFEVAPPIVTTELAGRRRRPEETEFAMSPEDVAKSILDALERDDYEVALGAAANLHRQRDALFGVIND